MPANYLILRDASFTLNAGQDSPTFPFVLPAGAVLAGNRSPILAFLVRPNPGVGTIQFRVDCNDVPQITATMGGDEKGGFWEVIDNNVANVGQNTIQFRGISGFGNVTFTDVVLWFQT